MERIDVVKEFTESQALGYLNHAAWEFIKNFAKDFVNNGKDYSEDEKEFGMSAIIVDIGRWWSKVCEPDSEHQINTEDEIYRFFNILATNALMHSWQWFNEPSRKKTFDQIQNKDFDEIDGEG